MRQAGRCALAGAAAALLLHLVSLASLLPAWRSLAPAAREAVAAISADMAWFQLQLAIALAAAGALAAVCAWGALRALAVRATAWRSLAGALLLLAALGARTLARKPALFEPMLWRRGGLPARFQAWLVEAVGAAALDRFLLGGLIVLGALVVLRRRQLLRRPWVIGAAAACLGAATLAAAVWPARAALTRGTSVVVLAADSLRPDRFSSEGNPHPTTPNLDALRPGALWVDHELVPIASTTASWASMLTGVYPHTHGLRDLFPREEQTRLRQPTLPRVLAAHGFRTAVVSDYAGETFRRVDFGFDVVDAPPATSIEIFAEREAFQRLPLPLLLFSGPLGQRLFPVAGYLMTNADPAALTDRALARLDELEQDGRPFLLLVFYSVTHAPFAPPMPDAAAFTAPGYAGQSRYSYEIQQVADIPRASIRPGPEEIEQVRALYDGALRSFDHEVGRVLGHLDASGLRDRIVVVTGDHGESLFEPGATTLHGKWFEGGEAANRTALLLQGRGIPAGRVRGTASAIDLMPTLLDGLGIQGPAGVEGRSLLRPLPDDRTVFAETTLRLGGKEEAPPGALSYPGLLDLIEVEPGSHALVLKREWFERTVAAKLRAAWRGPWELSYQPTEGAPRWKLVDLQRDPYAQRDRSSDRPEEFRALQKELLDWMRQDPVMSRSSTRLVAGSGP